MAQTLVIIPSYNEQDNIISLVEALFGLNADLDILVVDDGKDSTADLVRSKQASWPNLFLIKREGKGGRGSAVMAGFKFALEKGYSRAVEMDADFSHDPKELPRLLAASVPNSLVIGSRYLPTSEIINWPLKRRVFSALANFYANLVLGIGISDYTNGYRVYDRMALEKLDTTKIRARGYIVLSEIAYQLFSKGVVFIEEPTRFVNRVRGASNVSLKEVSEAFSSIIRIRYGKH